MRGKCLPGANRLVHHTLLLLLLLLQSTFVFKGFDEVRRLGLRQETEAVVRLAKARSHGAPGKLLLLWI
jgi:hypothetical protein